LHKKFRKMKKTTITAFIAIIITSSILFTGCKYEDGPFMSLRHKKMRLTNEWKFSKVTLGDDDITDKYNKDDHYISLDIYKSGYFSSTLRDLDGNPITNFITEQNFDSNLPFFNNAGRNGKWNFIEKRDKLEFGYDIVQPKDSITNAIYEIKELRNKRLKFKGIDPSTDKDVILEFEPIERK
jgi:hypothetical protein